jgi:hypothetical protein
MNSTRKFGEGRGFEIGREKKKNETYRVSKKT